MVPIISVRNLSKKYGTLLAVDNISFDVAEGSLFAFLGPNGAGKTTTINIICTLLGPSSGEVDVDGMKIGRDDSEIRRRIGVVFQDNVLDDLLTVRENLVSRGALYGWTDQQLRERVLKVADILSITELLNRRYGKLSGGQRRRTDIGRALMSDPRILFLDEPTTGLDPQTRVKVWQTIHQLQKNLGMTVFLTTHYMEEAAAADQVAIIDGGRIVASGTPAELKEKYSSDVLRLKPIDMNQLETLLAEQKCPFERGVDLILIPVRDSMQALDLLVQFKGSYASFEVVHGNMDDVFVNITGHKIREDV
jgi:multidrug/hemolysin transport system ATP-binding protein